MPRISPLSKDDVSGKVREAFEEAERKSGQTPVGLGIRAHAPPILEASKQLSAAPAKSGLLPAELRSLVCLRAAEIIGCPF